MSKPAKVPGMEEKDEKTAWFPPTEVSLRFCSACGRDFRLKHLRTDFPHNRPSGAKCPGTVKTFRYTLADD